ncbi:unnamed protein product, partial [Ilex paraguariensis]
MSEEVTTEQQRWSLCKPPEEDDVKHNTKNKEPKPHSSPSQCPNPNSQAKEYIQHSPHLQSTKNHSTGRGSTTTDHLGPSRTSQVWNEVSKQLRL